MRTLVLITLLFAAGDAAAQATLTLSPDTLLFPGQPIVSATNNSTAPTTLDSIAIAFAGPNAWGIKLELHDSTFAEYRFNSYYETSARSSAEIAPGEAALIRFAWFDPCVICKREGYTWGADTLLVYSGGTDEPARVILDTSTYVSVESTPTETEEFKLEIYPNPTQDRLTVEFDAREGRISLEMYDVLGRSVLSVQECSLGRCDVDVGALAPGVYFVEVVHEGEVDSSLKQSFVVFRQGNP